MKDVKLWFPYFWPHFNKYDNIFIWIFKLKYNVIIDSINPDIIITDGLSDRYPNSIKVYFSGEPFFPNLEDYHNGFDFGLSGYYINDSTHIRFPLYLIYFYEFMKLGIIDSINFFYRERNPKDFLKNKNKFCNIISRTLLEKRLEFFKKINEYKKTDTNVNPYKNIDLNEYGGTIPGSLEKMNIIKNYKFTISFDNSGENIYGRHGALGPIPHSSNNIIGYTGEKLLESFISGTLPIYWGNEKINEDFNSNCFINVHNYKNTDEVIELIKEIDNNDKLYMKYFEEPLIKDKGYLNLEYLMNCVEKITEKI